MDTDVRVSEYSDREALDRSVQNRVVTAAVPEALRIVGTIEELSRLHLSHGLSVYGVPVVASDYVAPLIVAERPKRGEVHAFGLNGQLRDEKGKPAKKTNRKPKK